MRKQEYILESQESFELKNLEQGLEFYIKIFGNALFLLLSRQIIIFQELRK